MCIQKGGIYMSLDSAAYGMKLKLLFECIPLGFLLIKAGGEATDAT